MFSGDRVACFLNNLGGTTLLEMNIIAKEAIQYLGEFRTLLLLVKIRQPLLLCLVMLFVGFLGFFFNF